MSYAAPAMVAHYSSATHHFAYTPAPVAGAASGSTGSGGAPAFDKGDSPSFSDLLDILNPLQHIPIVNTIYRQLTGDHEGAVADLVGGALYGGPIGLVAAMADVGVQSSTGKDIGENVVAMFGGRSDRPKATVTASANAAPQADANAAKPLVAASQTDSSAAKPLVAAAGAQGPLTAAPGATSPEPLTPPHALADMIHAGPMPQAAPVPAAASSASGSAAAVATGASFAAGPVAVGNYLVFGAGPAASDAGTSAPVASSAGGQSVGTNGPKQFTVYGGGAAPAATLPPVAGQPIPPAKVAGAGLRVFPVPARNGPAVTPVVLPPPTTGPGALPGGKSMALNPLAQAVAADPSQNFTSAYTQALDKYRDALRRANATAQPATDVAPVDSEDETTDDGASTALH